MSKQPPSIYHRSSHNIAHLQEMILALLFLSISTKIWSVQTYFGYQMLTDLLGIWQIIAKGISEWTASHFFQLWFYSKVMESERYEMHFFLNFNIERICFKIWMELKLQNCDALPSVLIFRPHLKVPDT